MSAPARALPRGERGSASALAALFLAGLVAVSGLVADGGTVLSERRRLQNLADASAAAGAMQLDVAAYRRSGAVALDPRAARQAASRLASADGVRARVAATPGRVSVEVERGVELTFLGLLGLGPVTVGAVARGEPRAGVGSAP